VLISQKEEIEQCPISSGVVLHDMIQWIYFYFIIFSQKRNGKREAHSRRGSSLVGTQRPKLLSGTFSQTPNFKHNMNTTFLLLLFHVYLEGIFDIPCGMSRRRAT